MGVDGALKGAATLRRPVAKAEVRRQSSHAVGASIHLPVLQHTLYSTGPTQGLETDAGQGGVAGLPCGGVCVGHREGIHFCLYCKEPLYVVVGTVLDHDGRQA